MVFKSIVARLLDVVVVIVGGGLTTRRHFVTDRSPHADSMRIVAATMFKGFVHRNAY